MDETIEEMEPEVSKLAIYQIKLEYERTMRDKAQYPKGYEKLRFEVRNLHDAVVVEAHCEKCNHYIPIAIKYLEYTKIARKAVPYPIILSNNKCPNCKMADSMTIPSFV